MSGVDAAFKFDGSNSAAEQETQFACTTTAFISLSTPSPCQQQHWPAGDEPRTSGATQPLGAPHHGQHARWPHDVHQRSAPRRKPQRAQQPSQPAPLQPLARSASRRPSAQRHGSDPQERRWGHRHLIKAGRLTNGHRCMGAANDGLPPAAGCRLAPSDASVSYAVPACR